MKNGLACASTTVPIFSSVSVPNSDTIKSNELKAPIVFKRETLCRIEGSKKETRVDEDLERRTSLKVYRNIEDSGENKTMCLNDSSDTSFSKDPRKLHTEKKGVKIGIFGVN